MGILMQTVAEINAKKEYRSRSIERICPVCGVKFTLCGAHQWKADGKYVCGYNCREKWKKEHPKRKYNIWR